MYFSAADLCKRSAAQIFYLRGHRDKIFVTPEQIAGIKKQAQQSKSEFVEMCGAWSGKHTIFFSWDEVQTPKKGGLDFIEHKMVFGDMENWYLQNAILQTACYAAMTKAVDHLQTAKFHVKKGNPSNFITIGNGPCRFYLQFGNTKYKIELISVKPFKEFLRRKATASMNWDAAVEFDASWKHKEFSRLAKYIKTKKV